LKCQLNWHNQYHAGEKRLWVYWQGDYWGPGTFEMLTGSMGEDYWYRRYAEFQPLPTISAPKPYSFRVADGSFTCKNVNKVIEGTRGGPALWSFGDGDDAGALLDDALQSTISEFNLAANAANVVVREETVTPLPGRGVLRYRNEGDLFSILDLSPDHIYLVGEHPGTIEIKWKKDVVIPAVGNFCCKIVFGGWWETDWMPLAPGEQTITYDVPLLTITRTAGHVSSCIVHRSNNFSGCPYYTYSVTGGMNTEITGDGPYRASGEIFVELFPPS
jgi:hypothetical protein